MQHSRRVLQNGDVVSVYGHRFLVSDVIDNGAKTAWGEPVFLFTGTVIDPNDSLKGTGYDGGRYSWRPSDNNILSDEEQRG